MKKIILLALALCCNYAIGQTWSLENCIYHALENNIQVKQSMIDIENSRIGVTQAKLDYIPSLGASVAYSLNAGRSLDPTTYNFVNNQTVNTLNGGASLSTTVFAGMTKLHNLAKSKLDLESYFSQNEKLKNDITLSVASAFLQVLYAKEQVSNSQSQVELLVSQLDLTKKLVEAGSLALGSQLELESQLAQENYNLVSYKNQREIALLNLKQLLEIRNMPMFDIVAPDLSKYTETPIADFEATYKNSLFLPQIEISKLSHEKAKEDVSLAKAKFYPTLSLNANYGSTWSDARTKPQLSPDGQIIQTYYPFFNQLGDNASASVQLALNIPIFTSLRAQNGLRTAKWNRQKAELNILDAENKLYKEVQQAHADAIAAKEKYASATVAVTSSQKSFEYAQQKFSAGATTSVDYNTAKNNLIIALSAQTQAKYEYILKSKILDFYNGIPIVL